MTHPDLIQQLRTELQLRDDEPDEAILNAVPQLKAEIQMALRPYDADTVRARKIIRQAAEVLGKKL